MTTHPYHEFFLPILTKLLQAEKTDEYIDITDCFTGKPIQDNLIFEKLNKSEFARVKKEAQIISKCNEPKPQRYFGTILPLGIKYLERISND